MTLRKVLLIDDEADIRVIGQLSLAQVGGWETALAASGEEALSRVQQERPDLILLDVMMPGMDGPTTYQRLRALEGSRPIPIIFMTAKVQKHEVSHYLEMGVAGVITKPFDPMTLPAEIRGILARS